MTAERPAATPSGPETLDEFMERAKDEPYSNSVKRIAWAVGKTPREVARDMEAIVDRCDKCGTPKSEWATQPCVKSLTRSSQHSITRLYLDPATRVENVWTGKP